MSSDEKQPSMTNGQINKLTNLFYNEFKYKLVVRRLTEDSRPVMSCHFCKTYAEAKEVLTSAKTKEGFLHGEVQLLRKPRYASVIWLNTGGIKQIDLEYHSTYKEALQYLCEMKEKESYIRGKIVECGQEEEYLK